MLVAKSPDNNDSPVPLNKPLLCSIILFMSFDSSPVTASYEKLQFSKFFDNSLLSLITMSVSHACSKFQLSYQRL